MNVKEVNGNLFDFLEEDVACCHCIAADFGMAGGIAKQFVDRMNMRNLLKDWSKENNIKEYKNPYENLGFTRPELLGRAIKVDMVFNLVTKLWTYEKPTYDTLYDALEDLKSQLDELGIKKLYMPKIGCGIDGLAWIAVHAIIWRIFGDTDIEVVVVNYTEKE